MKNIFKKLIVVSLLFSTLVNAENHIVDQKNKIFLPSKLTVAVGDTITFKNSDPFAHNAYTDEDENEFDVGMQATGIETRMVIKSKKSFDIECAIHPNMLIKVEVK